MAGEFRSFRVARKVAESDIITSFYLEPTDGAPLWPVKPGQYLTLKVPGSNGPVLKTYSVSCDPSETEFHRISVKREGRPSPDLPDGVGSCWLHDTVEVGSEVEMAAPRGTFVLDEDSTRPVILLSGGVGITPLLSMLHRLAGSERDVWFIHACENGDVHAMHDEVSALAEAGGAAVRRHTLYRSPTDADRAAKRHDAEGIIDKAFLQSVLPIDNYDVYMCGPTPFMVAMYWLLTELGVPKAHIAYEFFGKASSLDALAAAPVAAPSSKAASRAPKAVASLAFLTDPEAWAVPETQPVAKPASGTSGAGNVTFRKSGVTAAWDGAMESLLELAEDAGLNPEFSCRAGICNTCSCTLVEGEVEYIEEPLAPPEPGKVLICCSRPKGRVVLNI